MERLLPSVVIDHIKLFTGDGIWHGGKYVTIRKIPKNDPRRFVLSKIPLIKQVPNDNLQNKRRGLVWFKVNNEKFMVITVRYTIWHRHMPEDYYWEMQFSNRGLFMRLV